MANTLIKFPAITTLCIMLSASFAFCQTPRIDSLKKVLQAGGQTQKEELASTLLLCSQYNSLHPDSLERYTKIAAALARKLSSFEDEALASFYECLYQNKKGNTDSAMLIVQKNLSDKKVVALKDVADRFRLSKTGILVKQNKLKESLENALAFLHDAEKSGSADNQVKSQIQIGWVYMELNQYTDALNWFFTALSTNRTYRKLPEPSVLNSNIAAVYNSLKKNDSATVFILTALKQAKEEQDLSFLCNASYIYSDICLDMGNVPKAEELLKQGIEIRKKIGDPFYIVADLAQLGKFYANTNQYDKGIAAIKEGIAIAAENKLRGKLLFLNTMLAENYKAAKDLDNYSKTLSTIIQLKDTLYSQNSAEAVSELQTKYELQKKENTIIQQRFDLVEKTYWMYGAVALLLFGGILWVITIRNNKRKQQQKMELVLLEEKRLSEKAIADAQEKERKRIAADLHDNLGAYAAAISSNVDHISSLQKNSVTSNAYKELKSNAQSIVSQLNDTIWVLTKEVLALTAISDRLKVFIQRLRNSYPDVQIEVEEQIDNDILLTAIQAFHLFKVLQEAIINALKHSGCSQVTVSIQSDKTWSIVIADDGSGFFPGKKPESGGNGLFNMKNRSVEGGWKIEWVKNETGGTSVVIAETINQ